MIRKFSLALLTFALLGLALLAASAQDATPEATAEPTQPELVGTQWQWAEFQGMNDTTIAVEIPSDYLLTLNPDGSIGLRADCNVGTGSYTLDDSQLTLTPGAMTLAMCSEASLSNEYITYLTNVASYVLEDGELFLSLRVDGGIMRFVPVPPIISVVWQWQDFQSMDGTLTTVATPGNYTLTLNADGTATVKADCNNAGGDYALNSSQLTFGPMPTTMMACPGESMSAQFLTYLADVASFTVQDGELFLSLKTDAGIMRFAAAEPVITDAEWQWQDFQSMDGTLTTVATPENYTLTLNADGTANLKADCNSGSGSYTLDDSQLTFGEFATTRVACPADSLSDAYLGYLADVRSFVTADGELFLSLQMDGGIMRFAKAE